MERSISFVVPLALLLWTVRCDQYYSSYYGEPLTSDQVAEYKNNGTLANCTNLVAPCNETESRRIDGTCNNLRYPSSGATRAPYYRLLDASYNRTSDTVWDPRLSVCTGGPLPGARDVRRTVLCDGNVESLKFTQAITHFFVFFASDVVFTQDVKKFLSLKTYCCQEEGAKDPQCSPIPVPEDDYVHRITNIKCLNMTKPVTFQTSGCLPENTTPSRYVDATSPYDLSPIYGTVEEPARRTFENGMLQTEIIDGVIFPITTEANMVLGDRFFGQILWWRLHNHIAEKLAEINPCWTDEQIFATARKINIAFENHMIYYELMAKLMGPQNLIADGVIMDTSVEGNDYRDIYDDTLRPRVALEYISVLRWMHTMVGTIMKFFDEKGNYLNEWFPVVNLTSNIKYIQQNGRMAYIEHGAYRQACGKEGDNVGDSDFMNKAVGILQQSSDLFSTDLTRTRDYGLQPYINYRSYCFGDKITSFEQLRGIISDEGINALKEKYTCVGDIDLLVGLWLEILINGGSVPPTFYCVVTEQLLHNMKSDRFWHERQNRPNAFSKPQLKEIRKFTASRMFCDVGVSVTEIQPSAFELPGEGNEVVSCDSIPKIDYTVWKDESCDCDA